MICQNLSARILRYLTIIAVLATGAASQAAEWESIFNGKDLSGWKGKPEFWRVEDGAITGQTTPEKPTKGNTFIIWQGGEIGNFELKLKYRIIGGNSGIQYRSFEVKPGSFVVGGYQADFEAGKTYSGIVYGEKFRGILSLRGEKSVFTKEGKRKTVEKFGDSAELQKVIKPEEWNEYHIIADGFTFTHKINSQVMTILTDEHEAKRRAKGILALQLHAGPPMKVQFKDIELKRLK
jgi:hypothetical protein